jgi:hypothetical protein
MEPENGLFASDHAEVGAVFDLENRHPDHHGENPFYRNQEYFKFHAPSELIKHCLDLGFRRH